MPAGIRGALGELDRAQGVAAVHKLARREAILSVPGTAVLLERNRGGECARRLDRVSRSLLAEAGLAKAGAAAAHMVVYTYLLGSISLEESGAASFRDLGKRHAAGRFRAGLEVIMAGIRASAVW